MSFYVPLSVFQFISYLFKLIFIIEFVCFGGAVLDFQRYGYSCDVEQIARFDAAVPPVKKSPPVMKS
jgi:hypothetical protein